MVNGVGIATTRNVNPAIWEWNGSCDKVIQMTVFLLNTYKEKSKFNNKADLVSLDRKIITTIRTLKGVETDSWRIFWIEKETNTI